MAKQLLTISNLEGGEVNERINEAMREIQEAVLGNKAKGSLTIKIDFDARKSDTICAVTTEIGKSVPKTKFSTLYNKGSQYLVADPVPVTRGKQEEIPGTGNVVQLNQAQA